MKKSGKSGGKGIIPLPPGRFFLLTLLFTLLAAAGVRAQNPPVSINAKAITINELFTRIEKQGVYTFAYNNADIDLKRVVTVHAKERPIESIVRECLPEVNVQVSNNKVILTARRSDQSSMPMHKLTGTVTDENGAPVTGATVIVVGTQRGTTTSATGAYTLQVRNGEILEFQYLGYEKQAVSVGGQTTLDVTLQPSKAMAVDEVVVIGYGTVKKGDATGSVANIKISDVKDLPVLSVDQALQGRVAGADIMSTTGEPGATTSIRIRGTRSISASNEPLIVVDGVMDAVSDLNDLNMADIESVTILKDASSTAIYGSRGSNGVIIVTTKGGGNQTNTKPSITLKADIGFSQLPRKLDVMNATEFALYRNDFAYFSTQSGYEDIGEGTPQSKYPFKDPFSLGKGTDWIDEITRTAPYQNYSLSISGRSKKSSYYASLGYNDSQGIIDNSGLQRITGRLNLDHQLFKWLKVGYRGSYTWRDNAQNLAEIGGTAYYRAAMYLSPHIDPQENYNPLWGNGQRINTPRATIDQNTYSIERTSLNHTAYLEVALAKGLKLRSQNSYYSFQRHTYRYYPGSLPAKNEGEGGQAYRAEFHEFSLSSENTLSYKLETKSGHNIDALAGFTAYRYKSDNFTLSGQGYMDDDVLWNNMNAVTDKETYSAATGLTKRTKMSLLARFNYNYKQRYYLTVTGRYDGSSNFAANNKWGFFPSVALKWNAAKENFLKDVRWIDELSLRLSAGRTGNDAISAYRSLAAMSSTTSGYLFDGMQPGAYYRSRLASPNLTWEKTDLYNAALDLAFFNNRLMITAEGYISKTRDLLLTVQTASATGYTSRYANIGKTSNKGVELSIESRNIVRPKFSWTTNLTIAHNKQNVDDIGSEDFVTALSSPGNNPYMMYGYVKGYPLNALWGFKYGDTWKSVEEFERNSVTNTYVSALAINSDAASRKASLGMPRYYDINNDGSLNNDDLVYQGNADPDLYGGLQNNFRFGRLNVGIYFTYSLGGKIYNYSELYMAGSSMSNQYRYMLEAWHPVRNPQSNLPRAGAVDAHVPSDLMIYDASYIRLKNITVGYTFDLSKRSKFIRDITLNLSAENLHIWKKYNGFDPDVSTDSSDSALRRVDLGAYPKPRTIVFSIQLRY